MRHVLVMTGAGSIGLIAAFLVDFLSLLYVSRLNDAHLTAAVGFSSQVLFFPISIEIGLSIAIGAVVSRAIGAGDRVRARQLAASGLVHVGLLLAVLVLAIMPFLDEILIFAGASGEALEVGSRYLAVTLPSMIFLGFAMALGGLLRAAGDAKRSMYVTLGGGVVTAILDPLFIFTLGLGVQGAAIVAFLSRIACMLVGLHGAVLRHDLIGRPRLRAIAGDARPIFGIAIPAILTNLAAPVANLYCLRISASFGEGIVAAFALIDRLTPLAFGVLFALSGSVGPIMAQNLGACLPHRVRRTFTDCLIVSAVYTIVVWVVLWLAAPALATLFAVGGETRQLLVFFCTYGGALWLFLGGIFVANAAFNNLGYPLLSTFFNWGRATLGTIPFVTLGAHRFGAIGILLGLMLGAVLFGLGAMAAAYVVTNRLIKNPKNV
ncbi:MATE family efflux transporter [Beijerinckia indica]|uniref:MATE efflux family protein n=1 Tax=Beijerinckia indica subsp. indica (strain ATCC 9039 / DSM 1715 / NCIMB 8712) TaxID=395963 RepID=B2IH85_BEII9|nr:MATE family efflux transporter [Beijerinckia indica]ACB95870.1 MATE efflux family protein [Beijerinckia indica subsp. indica ATCC 9039]